MSGDDGYESPVILARRPPPDAWHMSTCNLSAPDLAASLPLAGLSLTGAIPEKGGRTLRTYELIFIAQPDLDEEHLNALVEHVQQTITTHGGQLVKTEPLGRRKLAYPIKKRREGHYVLIHAGLELATIAELERDLKLSEDVLRYLLVRLDEIQ